MAITKKSVDTAIKQLANEEKKRSVRLNAELSGLHLVVTKKGTCSWVLKYRFDGEQVSFTFAYYAERANKKSELPVMTEAEAVGEAIRLKAMIRGGINIKEVAHDKKRHQRELDKLGVMAKVDEFTVNDVVEFFFAKYAIKNWRGQTLKNAKQRYDRHVRPVMGNELWDGVTFTQWRNLFSDIAEGARTGRPAPNPARDLAIMLKQAHGEALYAEKVTNSAIMNIKISRIAQLNKERDRTLNEFELGQVWHWSEPVDTLAKIMTRILLSTNSRTHEIRVSRCKAWDLTTKVWTIPNSDSKNGERIVRPIPDHLLPLVTSQIETNRKLHAGKPAKVFNNALFMAKQYEQSTMSSTMSGIHQQLGMERFTAHDLRRTCSTLQNELGLNDNVIESLLGHKQERVKRTYNHSSMLESKRELMQQWFEYLERCKDKYLQANS